MKKAVVVVLSAGALISCGTDVNGDGSGTDPTGIGASTDNDEVGTESATGDGDGDSTETPTGDGDGDSTGPTGDGDGDDSDSDGQKWDVLAVPDGGSNCGVGGGGGEEPEFSYLWAANSGQGTISKIDTKTVTEVGRYIVRPDSNGSPSRTSVSLSGHVAVANRNGGVTKIYADEQFCDPNKNGQPGIQTSNSAAYLPWDQDDCVAWHRPMAYLSQRPVAWGPGTFNNGTCQWEEEELWTSGTNQGGTIDIHVLDGDDGSTKEMIVVPTGGAGLSNDNNGTFYGLYGAAVDGDGNFWATQLGTMGKLIRVKRADMSWQVWTPPVQSWWYGMTVDADGMVWMCSSTVARFDPVTESWATASVGGSSGCMADAAEDGLLWMAAGGGVVGVNRDTLAVEKNWPTNGSYGVSIDFEGYVWAVAFGSNATKLDPVTGEIWTYSGLVGAYTYSDMTGYALSNVGTPNG